jgi:hypothetical protein
VVRPVEGQGFERRNSLFAAALRLIVPLWVRARAEPFLGPECELLECPRAPVAKVGSVDSAKPAIRMRVLMTV